MTPQDAVTVADELAEPAVHRLAGEKWWRQSLAHGAPGIALLHIELAARGIRPWARAHTWLSYAASAPVTSGGSSGAFYGAPAVAYALATAAAVRPGSYQRALTTLHARIGADIQHRLREAGSRIDCGRTPLLAEFDTLRGLAGLGAHLLHRDPGSPELRELLSYLVRLAQPLTDQGEQVPGWWTKTAPTGRVDPAEFPGGHANLGLAHGIGGPLSLLSICALREVTVPRHTEAINVICRWTDRWRTDSPHGARWPYMVTWRELAAGPPTVVHSGARRRPSWCYGTAGAARVQQLAAVATGDIARQRMAEAALIGALTDPEQLTATVDATLCHGHAGLAAIATRAAELSDPPAADQLRALAADRLAATEPSPDCGPGLLEGTAGSALAALAAAGPPATAWDTCLLIA
ncbi:lanthionine synthetase C family protein [Streptomyces chumphonensis]|uniref:lanthionine synthetase C family protein n=1 Tax=Streptomyces chumphonensis TaxID=1214925 RepID=UPI003D71FB76